MTPTGWTIMAVSITAVLLLTSYCLYRVFTLPPVEMESLHGPPNIEPEEETEEVD